MFSERHLVALSDPEDVSRPVRFVARQPIMFSNQRVLGYELLFRSGVEDYFKSVDPDDATRSVVDISSLLGLDILCSNRLGFINCTRATLFDECVTLLPADRVVIEILEDITPDSELRRACQTLKSLGYKLALDDFTNDDPRDSLSDLVDFIKIDMRLTHPSELPRLAMRYGAANRTLIAEKVETRDEVAVAESAGIRLFQGFFFQKPTVIRKRGLLSNHSISVRLLQTVSKPELDWSEIEDLIKKDAALSFRILRYLNSAKFALHDRIKSLRHALFYLGEDEVRRWCRLSVLLGMTQKRTSELILCTVTRARFGELLGMQAAHGNVDLFLLGMLSLMDSILEISMCDLIELLPIDHEIESVLLGKTTKLSPLFQLVLATESGEWGTVAGLCKSMHLAERFVADAFRDALQWACELCSIANAIA